jgi:hypothetical protein
MRPPVLTELINIIGDRGGQKLRHIAAAATARNRWQLGPLMGPRAILSVRRLDSSGSDVHNPTVALSRHRVWESGGIAPRIHNLRLDGGRSEVRFALLIKAATQDVAMLPCCHVVTLLPGHNESEPTRGGRHRRNCGHQAQGHGFDPHSVTNW